MTGLISRRSYLIAGVAALSAAAVVVAPVQDTSQDLAFSPHQARTLAVGLAAAVTPVDPITAWIDTLTATGNNAIGLVVDAIRGNYVSGNIPGTGSEPQRNQGYQTGVPLPVVQQIVQNVATYLGELPDLGTIAGQVFANVGNALGAPFQPGEETPGTFPGIGAVNYNQNVSGETVATLVVPLSQRMIGALLPAVAPDLFPTLAPILAFATTPISGVLVGALGPVVAPVLSVVNSITNAIALLQEANFLGAVTELVNIPANAVNAFLNGGPTLDLTGLVSALGVALPSNVESLGLKMGGLLSPGGVAFDALAAKASVTVPVSATINATGLPVGPIGALVGLTNYVSAAIKVTPAPTAAAQPAAGEPSGPASPAAVSAAIAAVDAAPAPTVSAADVATEVAAVADNDTPDASGARGVRNKGGRGDGGSADHDAPKASAAKAGASRG